MSDASHAHGAAPAGEPRGHEYRPGLVGRRYVSTVLVLDEAVDEEHVAVADDSEHGRDVIIG
jgi:hypothetical protein